MSKKPALRTVIIVTVLIAAVSIAVFLAHQPVLSAKAVSFDDNQYLTDYNPLVQKPSLTSAWQILNEVFSPSSAQGYYQPLSIISVMLDYAAGANAKNFVPFHRTNLILHVLNTALLIVLLYIIFSEPITAAMAGLLFGVHPLTVEPIAWISDRKTLLAMFFALWCLIFYVRYARTNSRGFYIASIAMYAFALMSKPTSLPLCVALLVMDYWPLGRISNIKYQISKLRNGTNLILEKIPFFVLGGVFVVITVISNARTVNTLALESSTVTKLLQLPLVICYLISFYLSKIIWPVNLSSVYVMPKPISLSNPLILIGVTAIFILVIVLAISVRRTRVLPASFLFFFVVISPTLGLVRFSDWISASDKYVYMPAIGLLMALTWCFGLAFTNKSRIAASQKLMLIVFVLFLSAGETYGLRRYLAHWRSTESLCEYMLKLTPDAAPVHENLANVLQLQGRYDEAAGHYNRMLQQDANSATAHNNLGSLFLRQGKSDEALSHFSKALRIRPGYADAHNNMGIVLSIQGNTDEAIKHYRQALRLKPCFSDAHNNLGMALQSIGKFDEALYHYQQALQFKPDYLASLNGVAWILATEPDPNARDIKEAAVLAERAVKLTGHQDVTVLDTLATAYAAADRFGEAVETAKRAVELAQRTGQNDAAVEISKKLVLYENHKTYRRLAKPVPLKP